MQLSFYIFFKSNTCVNFIGILSVLHIRLLVIAISSMLVFLEPFLLPYESVICTEKRSIHSSAEYNRRALYMQAISTNECTSSDC